LTNEELEPEEFQSILSNLKQLLSDIRNMTLGAVESILKWREFLA